MSHENVSHERLCVSYVLSYDKKKQKNVNKNNVEYILRLYLVNVTWRHPGDIIMSPRVTVKRWTYDNAQRHVTAFRPISEAAHSRSYDSAACLSAQEASHAFADAETLRRKVQSMAECYLDAAGTAASACPQVIRSSPSRLAEWRSCQRRSSDERS